MKKLYVMLSIATVLVLSACGNEGFSDETVDGEESTKSESKNEKQPSSDSSNEMELVYFEPVSNANDYLYYEIGVINNGTFEYVRWKSDKIVEHILKEDIEPYVIQDGSEMHIYRQPMMIYTGEEIEATVESKEKVE